MSRSYNTDENILTDKDMSVLREGDKTKTQRDLRRGVVRDYGLKHTIEIRWDLNEEATRDRICSITFDGKTAFIDSEEMMRLLRWV
ncbi:MAG: hypothetical protein ACXABY_20785 [Candidatus Thorarchaeota archaeon]|jgi:hypothetical protein